MRCFRFGLCVAFVFGVATSSACAGLYYSAEAYAELPSQWRGFLLDQRNLRTLAARPSGSTTVSPRRKQYEKAAARLQTLGRQRTLTADEAADLGAILLRLGQPSEALAVLRKAALEHPRHRGILANLGTAWQMDGNLPQAAACLEQAALLADEKQQAAERLHLKLVRRRMQEKPPAGGLDELFGVRYVGSRGRFEPGQLAESQRLHLPPNAIALVQQLALWLPADGRVLWQLGELAGASGDVASAATILDVCVTELGLRDAELLQHRRAYRAAADEKALAGSAEAKARHEGHTALFKPRSSRPLVRKIDSLSLPPINPQGVNTLPWAILPRTTVERPFRPRFPRYLQELENKQVTLTGYLQPVGDDPEMTSFLLVEYPVGCWYCEQPEMTAIVLVELAEGRTLPFTRDPVSVRGKLVLNAEDPENFLYILRQAAVSTGNSD